MKTLYSIFGFDFALSAIAVIIALSIVVMIFCLWCGVNDAKQKAYFLEGGYNHMLLMTALKSHLVDEYPRLMDECKCDIELTDEQHIKGYQYRVRIRFDCHDTCHANDKSVWFRIDAKAISQNDIQIVCPISDEAIKEYHKDFDI